MPVRFYGIITGRPDSKVRTDSEALHYTLKMCLSLVRRLVLDLPIKNINAINRLLILSGIKILGERVGFYETGTNLIEKAINLI